MTQNNTTANELFEDTVEQESANDAPELEPKKRRSSSRHKKSRRYQALERKAGYLQAAVGILSAICILGIILGHFVVEGLRKENTRLNKETRKQNINMVQLQVELDKIRSANEELVMGRIPNLQRLEFGQVIAGTARYVDSILFTVTSKGSRKRFEYLAVLRNDNDTPVQPKVEIYLFDEVGVQVSRADVIQLETAYDRRLAVMQPGESRSFSSKLVLGANSEPKYFLIKSTAVTLGTSG